MKKILIPTLAVLAGISFASAEQKATSTIKVGTGQKVMHTEGVEKGMDQKMGTNPTTKVAPQGEAKNMMGGLMLGITGDKATDDALLALRKEYEGKAKALFDEYQTKAKVIVGDKKMGSIASSTMIREKFENEMKNIAEKKGMASSTAEHPFMDMKGRVEGTSTVPLSPFPKVEKTENVKSFRPQASVTGSVFGFFKSLLGGNALPAEAQTQAQ